jgi:hypothetical protein
MSMWVRVDDNKVEDLETNNGFAVKANDDAQLVRTWSVVRYTGNAVAGNLVLAQGYRSEVEAQNALTELLSDMGVDPARIQPPVTDEEIEEVN